MNFFPITWRLHREGRRIIPATGLLVGSVLLVLILLTEGPIWNLITNAVAVVGIVLIWLVLNFFRDPVRTAPTGSGLVVAPCDGKVVVIEEVEETLYFKTRVLQVSIFMSPLDVHVNRTPISGTVQHVQYKPGKYLVAWHPKSSTDNEQTFLAVSSDERPGVVVGFKQIAGALARRICWYVKPGAVLARGAEFGFIRFGSRMDVLLPLGTQVNVQLGQRTVGGETVIALLK